MIVRSVPRWSSWLALVVLVLVASACGGEAVPTSVDAATTVVPPVSGTDSTGSTTESGNDPGVASAGVVTIGDQTWQFAPRQCDVFAANTVSIWGSAASDPGVEIIFDVFDADQFNFEVNVDGAQWTAPSDDIVVVVNGQDVTGTATVSDFNSGDSSTATFEFHCG